MNNFLKLTPRVFIFTNLLWFLLFGFLLFNYKCSNEREGNTDCTTFCYDYSKEPFPGLKALVATSMVNNYDALYQLRDASNNPRFDQATGKIIMDQNETKSVWFSLKSMKNFIYQMERNTCKLNCSSASIDNLGIRFYFAKYPSQTEVQSRMSGGDTSFDFLQRSQLYGRKTLLMVPTYYDQTSRNDVDFDPKWIIDKGDLQKCNPKSLSTILIENKSNLSVMRITAGMPDNDPNGLQNHQPVCPPDNCPGQSF